MNEGTPELMRPHRTCYGVLVGLAIASVGREMFANFRAPDGRILFFAVPDFELFGLLCTELQKTALSRFVAAKEAANLTIWKNGEGIWRSEGNHDPTDESVRYIILGPGSFSPLQYLVAKTFTSH
jgi:hypothetical protein